MKIYTKTGDKGETGLYGGKRVSKDDLRIHAYGTLDELNAALGVALSIPGGDPGLRERLVRIQSELFVLGAELATPKGRKLSLLPLSVGAIRRLETEIDAMEGQLSPLKTFILPGGSALSAQLHFARTVSRRAEREIITLHRKQRLRPEVVQYINRLSDHLFVCARFANHAAGVTDVPWVK